MPNVPLHPLGCAHPLSILSLPCPPSPLPWGHQPPTTFCWALGMVAYPHCCLVWGSPPPSPQAPATLPKAILVSPHFPLMLGPAVWPYHYLSLFLLLLPPSPMAASPCHP